MPGLVWAVMTIMFFGLNETSAYAAVAVTTMPACGRAPSRLTKICSTWLWGGSAPEFSPPDFPWPDKTNLDIEKRYLRESTEMGIFPKEAAGVIDGMFVP